MSTPLFAGWMKKKGSFVSSWKRRYFCLYRDAKLREIRYYEGVAGGGGNDVKDPQGSFFKGDGTSHSNPFGNDSFHPTLVFSILAWKQPL